MSSMRNGTGHYLHLVRLSGVECCLNTDTERQELEKPPVDF